MIRLPCLTTALFAATLCTLASAQQQCYRDNVNTGTTSFTSSARFPKFDPAVGTLVAIHFDVYSQMNGTAKVENTGNSAVTAQLHFKCDISLERPDNSVIVTDTPTHNFTDNLTAFDGTLDYGGTSGRTHSNISQSSHTGHVSPTPASDLALFTGPSGNPGSITLPVVLVNSSNATGGTSLNTQFPQTASARIDICYDFIKDCNHNGIDDSIDIQNGTSNDADGDGIPDECEPSAKVFCEGDGAANGGINCPCNNNSNPNDHSGCLNSTGHGAHLVGSGNPSVSNDTFLLTVNNLPPSVPGYFIMGSIGISQIGYFDGVRCFGGTITRVSKIVSAPLLGGSVSYPPQGGPTLSQQLNIPAGATKVFQVIYRNHGGPCLSGANASNGVIVVWGQ